MTASTVVLVRKRATRGATVLGAVILGHIGLFAMAHSAPAFSSPAVRGPLDGAPLSARVRVSDLDLRHESGRRALYGRLQAAARSVCEPYDARGLTVASRQHACIVQALDAAVDTVGDAGLTALHRAHAHPELEAAAHRTAAR